MLSFLLYWYINHQFTCQNVVETPFKHAKKITKPAIYSQIYHIITSILLQG